MLVLVVDSDRRCQSQIQHALRGLRGARVTMAPSLAAGLKVLARQTPELIIVSLELRDGSGLQLLEHEGSAGQPMIVASGGFSQDVARQVLSRRRTRIIDKPLDIEQLEKMAKALLGSPAPNPASDDRAELLAGLRGEVETPMKPELDPSRPWENEAIIGEAPSWRRVLEQVRRVADTSAEVLLLGQSGTGKELVAKAVHSLSPRADRNFVAVNCAAIPPNLLESELFGHVKGAFTGAVRDRKGRFKEADHGTIFLDEIGEMPLDLQAKLLRVLQEKRFAPVGSDQEVAADFRVVAATNVNLDKMVADGSFREDLYYRLDVFPVLLPRLADRPSDIPALSAHFLAMANRRYNRRVTGFAPEVMETMCAAPWPGNVRQLENTISRLVILAGEGPVLMEHLPATLTGAAQPVIAAPEAPKAVEPTLAPPPPPPVAPEPSIWTLPGDGIDLKKTLADLECSLIDQALERTDGNRNQAARMLNLNRTTLVEKLRKRG